MLVAGIVVGVLALVFLLNGLIPLAVIAGVGAFLLLREHVEGGSTTTRSSRSTTTRSSRPTATVPDLRPGTPSLAMHGREGRANYRLRDRSMDYVFELTRVREGWRAYILTQRGYGRRDTSLHATHRLQDNGRYYVCWDRPVSGQDEMLTICALWAEATERYIATGQSIDAAAADILREKGDGALWIDARPDQ